jgi:hypothetical protein
MSRILAAGLLLGVMLAPEAFAGAEEPLQAPTDSTAAAAPSDPLSNYLDDLSSETEESFGTDIFSISDAEIDSLVRIYEETGRSPWEEDSRHGGRRGWSFDYGVEGLRYNRVEGINLTAEGSVEAPTSRTLRAFGELGYAWALEKGTWLAGVRGRLANGGGAPTLEANYGRRIPVYGSGDIPGNTAAALFFGEDYGDYFLSERWSFWFQWSPGPARLDLNYRIEKQQSVRKQTDWSLFESDAVFRSNPPIDDADVRLIQLTLGYGDAKLGPWAAELEAVTAGRGLGGDFDYESFQAELIGRRTIWFGDQITVKATGGGTTGDTPYQALHHLGGFRLLRGYDINEIPARQFAHLRLDYKIGTDVLGVIPYVNRLRLQLVPFFDSAAIFELQGRDGSVIDPVDPEFRFSSGFGVQKNLLGIPGGSGQLRLDLARRLDRDDDAMTFRVIITMEG